MREERENENRNYKEKRRRQKYGMTQRVIKAYILQIPIFPRSNSFQNPLFLSLSKLSSQSHDYRSGRHQHIRHFTAVLPLTLCSRT